MRGVAGTDTRIRARTLPGTPFGVRAPTASALFRDPRNRAKTARGEKRANIAASIANAPRAQAHERQAARVRKFAHPFECVFADAKRLLDRIGRIDHIIIGANSSFCARLRVGCTGQRAGYAGRGWAGSSMLGVIPD